MLKVNFLKIDAKGINEVGFKEVHRRLKDRHGGMFEKLERSAVWSHNRIDLIQGVAGW